MSTEIHASDPAVAPAGDLLPPSRRTGLPRITVVLGAGVLVAAAFLGGVQAQKTWGDDGNSGGRGNFGRFAAASGPGDGGTRTTAPNGGQPPQGAQGAPGGFFRGGGFATGTVKLVKGSTIYVTTQDGNTVKVSVPASTSVTKTVAAKVSSIKPGDRVTAIGPTSNGVVKAAEVRVGDLGVPTFRRGFGGGQRNGGQGGQSSP
jgi:hypothetical protein